MQVIQTKTPMLKTLYNFAARDGESSPPPTPGPLTPWHQLTFQGIPSLWAGLSASILRQSTYSTARFGLYAILTQHARDRAGGASPSQWTTILCAAAAGGAAGVIGNPAEVILVRMCADGARQPGERHNYPDAFRGLARIAREEGPAALGRGLGATVVRSVLMNVGQIAP